MSSSGVLQEHLTQLSSVDLVNVALRSVVSGYGIRNPGAPGNRDFFQHKSRDELGAGDRTSHRRIDGGDAAEADKTAPYRRRRRRRSRSDEDEDPYRRRSRSYEDKDEDEAYQTTLPSTSPTVR
nr:hypothetical protein Iba_chr04eCG19770 [Ipomoea batatas]